MSLLYILSDMKKYVDTMYIYTHIYTTIHMKILQWIFVNNSINIVLFLEYSVILEGLFYSLSS